jgi:hypothetical protein
MCSINQISQWGFVLQFEGVIFSLKLYKFVMKFEALKFDWYSLSSHVLEASYCNARKGEGVPPIVPHRYTANNSLRIILK